MGRFRMRLRISKSEWLGSGGLCNSRLFRTRARNGIWYYWLNYY